MHLMSLGYASPEQVRGGQITTASDIFSLGVILYELLTAKSPFRLPGRPDHGLPAAICGEEPARPSAHQPQARGDLDNIVLMALRKNPAERYGSADQLSEDIRRCLHGLPVAARGEGFSYLAQKFVRRHKFGVASAALLLATLIGGVITTKRAEARAERRFNDVRKLAHSVVFDYHDSIEGLPGATPVRRRLVRDALEYLDSLSTEADDPGLQRELIEAYVRISRDQGDGYYTNLGDAPGALKSVQKAISLSGALLDHDPSPESLESASNAFATEGDLHYEHDELPAAQKSYVRAVALGEQALRQRPGSLDWKFELSVVLSHLGDLYGAPSLSNLGLTEEALAAYEKGLAIVGEIISAKPGDNQAIEKKQQFLTTISAIEQAAGHPHLAELRLRNALPVAEQILAANPDNTLDGMKVAGIELRLGLALMDQASPAAAAEIDKALKLVKEIADADPQNLLYRRSLGVSEGHMADALLAQGNAKEALPHNRQSLALLQSAGAANQQSAEYRSDIAVARRRLAETILNLGLFRQSMDEADVSVEVLAEMARGSGNNKILGELAQSWLAKGRAQMALHETATALDSFTNADQTLSELMRHTKSTAVLRRDLARIYQEISGGLVQSGEPARAGEFLARAILIYDQLRSEATLMPVDEALAAKTSQDLARMKTVR